VSSARNCGIKNSAFDFIAFLDSDDEWEKDYLEKISMLIKKFPDCIGFGTYYRRILRYGRETVKVTARFEENALFTISSVTNQLIKGDLPFFTSSIVIKKEILIETGMFHEQINCGEDLLTWIKVSTVGEIGMLSKICVNYNISIPENGRLRRKNDLLDNFAIEIKKLNNKLPPKQMNLVLSGWFYARYLNALVTENRFTNIKSTLIEYKKMIVSDPLNFKRISTIILLFIPSKFIDKLLLYKK
jgi:glycosyltransferase involved in cell wall biosynthesis